MQTSASVHSGLERSDKLIRSVRGEADLRAEPLASGALWCKPRLISSAVWSVATTKMKNAATNGGVHHCCLETLLIHR